MPDLLLKKSYHYHLPKELIAQYPLSERSNSRLMVIHRKTGDIEHCRFHEIIKYLKPQDVLVLNSTKVIPARLCGSKENGAQVEIFLLQEINPGIWKCLLRPGRKVKHPQKICFNSNLSGFVSNADKDGIREIYFNCSTDLWQEIESCGHVPLPPYIDRNDTASDHDTYQTVYAKTSGSVAAPTAGLHFTSELLEKIKSQQVLITEVLLHIGLGTFRPVKTDNITHHKMHSEFCSISGEVAETINHAKKNHERVIAVGTTSVRTLESFFEDNRLTSGERWTDIFIYPGKQFNIVDAMVTNFHLPESTLLMLVAAFAGYDLTMEAYREAVKERYRFFSYGDAMLII